jgi:formamidopyrimidine-DNA glycosylase
VSELPELEVLKRDIEREIVGRRIKSVEVRPGSGPMKAIRHHGKRKEFTDLLVDVKLDSVERAGRRILVGLDSSNALVIDLGEGATLVKTSASDEMQGGTQVVMTFTIGGQLRFVDPDKTGQIFVTTPEETAELRVAKRFEIDPLDGQNPLAWQHFSQLLVSKGEAMKGLLMDESFIVGLGDMYSDEILWAAGLRYDHPSNDLSSQDVRRLYRALLETLNEATKARGTSVGSHPFVDLSGARGEYQSEIKVFERQGEACPRCRNTIEKHKFHKRVTYLCPQCQS